MIRAWVVGQNEGPIIGEGWYDRGPDWFGFPFRESFARGVLRIPALAPGDRLNLLLGSALAYHMGSQEVVIRLGSLNLKKVLRPPFPKSGWEFVSFRAPSDLPPGELAEVVLETPVWRHSVHDGSGDFREVGLLLGALFLSR
ncbi:MAG: hypothetical protein HUU16_09605 [Candidatus Omnitrophica bacterium]|nr:hypothetical protein [bacterium]NUN96417.1 hypothetical protein [Candidatus Omnitrophota bacterium]